MKAIIVKDVDIFSSLKFSGPQGSSITTQKYFFCNKSMKLKTKKNIS